MCGIAGFAIEGRRGDLSRRLTTMTNEIAHRGPDGDGSYISDGPGRSIVGLGHRRLAIIDLAGGMQPFVDHQTNVALTYNGELYNFVRLRDELKRLGHAFQTSSDTEVVLRSYLAWGTKCFSRFRGMFALAIWDPRQQALVLARDQFGKKPLFVRQIGNGLLFGSEPKAILAWGGPKPALDLNSVSDLLVWRYVPGPYTLFSDIQKIRPGHWATWDGIALREQRYFDAPYSTDVARDEPADPIAAFRDLLDEAVRLRMASDVPFGAFLSGGIDSSAVVALMSRHSSERIRTFSVGFQEQQQSELKFASLVAREFRTNHTELVVSAKEIMDFLPQLVRASDAPVSEPSNIPIWLISKKASETVKMVLTGEGADELLGGYPKHSAERFVHLWQLLVPRSVQKALVDPALNALPFRYRRVKTLAASLSLRGARERYPRWMGALSFSERDKMLAIASGFRHSHDDPFRAGSRRSPIESILLFDQLSWLPDNLLERGDRMTMAASIEARMPFMDTVLATFVAKLSDKWRVRGLSGKHILREAMKPILPPEIIYRKKIGFRVPVAEWFRGPMREFIRDHLDSSTSLTRCLYEQSELRRVLHEHEIGQHNHEKLLWLLLNLEIFQRTYQLPSVAIPPTAHSSSALRFA